MINEFQLMNDDSSVFPPGYSVLGCIVHQWPAGCSCCAATAMDQPLKPGNIPCVLPAAWARGPVVDHGPGCFPRRASPAAAVLIVPDCLLGFSGPLIWGNRANGASRVMSVLQLRHTRGGQGPTIGSKTSTKWTTGGLPGSQGGRQAVYARYTYCRHTASSNAVSIWT